jgi:hypothetical protein
MPLAGRMLVISGKNIGRGWLGGMGCLTGVVALKKRPLSVMPWSSARARRARENPKEARMMSWKMAVVLATVLVGGVGLAAAEWVGVSGSDTKYLTPIDKRIGGQDVKLVLTGTGVRTKYFFNVYAIAGYLQEGIKVRSAAELAATDHPKMLHLVMERDVDGPTMAESFEGMVRANYPKPAFAGELKQLTDYMKSITVHKGAHVYLTHIPKIGFHCQLVGQQEILIKNPAFSKAVWDIYLGKNNVGDAVKSGLTSRL